MADQTQEQAALALLDQLMSNPETRRTVQLAVKKVNPKANIPELDAAAPLERGLNALNQKIESLQNELLREKAQNDINSKHTALKARGYGDEGIRKIENLMVERNIGDYEAAEALFERQNPPIQPGPPGYSGSMFMDTGADDFKNYAKNPNGWVDEETGRALADFRSGRAH